MKPGHFSRRALLVGALAITAGAAQIDSARAQTVGNVGAVNPDATGAPPGAGRRKLSLGAGVVQSERVQTDAQGSTQVVFTDRSALNIGRNSNVVIDKFVFDPASGAGEMTTTMTRGALRFVGGQVSHDTGVTIRTPAATIGVRGGMTTLAFDAAGALHVIHHKGVSTVQNGGGLVHLRRGGFESIVTSFDAPPGPPHRVDPVFLAQVMARLTSSKGQKGGAKIIPTDLDSARFGIGSQRLGAQAPDYDLPGLNDNQIRGETLTHPYVPPPIETPRLRNYQP